MLQVQNTISQKKETFEPKKNKKINLFVCGPTVYDYAHIGHARTYVSFDIIAKYLKSRGYKVFYLQNITDVDDKIIKRAQEKNVSWKELSKNFEKEYLADVKSLKINSVTKYARATSHIKEIISQVKRLLEKGYAYAIEKDGVYYDVSKFKEYGKLSKRTALQAEDAISRIDESLGKRNKADFCLWKFSKPGEPTWKSPFGPGRPGWHIEDTAITEKYFGPQYDIHGGARDLIFPHHEAEIAQMEAISGKAPLVKYWLHTGFLTVKGEKMGKSLGNFVTIRDLLKDNSPRLLRFFVLKSHYRSPIDYTEKSISDAKKELERLDEFLGKLKKIAGKKSKSSSVKFSAGAKEEFEAAMADDFNTPKALAAIFTLINTSNAAMARNELNTSQAKGILKFLKEIDAVFDFIFWREPKQKIPEDVIKLAKEREKYRAGKDWKSADEIRQKITDLGYSIEDTEGGMKIKKNR